MLAPSLPVDLMTDLMTTRKPAAILFADIAGSSRLYKSLGDDSAEAAVRAVVAGMKIATEQFAGEVIKTIGDEIMASFESAEAGIRAAIEIQRQQVGSSPPIRIRSGVQFAPVLVRDRDVFGNGVNDAAYLTKIARGGQIVTTGDTVSALPDDLQARAMKFDRVPLKGSREPTVIYLVRWAEVENRMGAAGSTEVIPAHLDAYAEKNRKRRLEVKYQERHLVLELDELPLVVGRDPSVATLPVKTGVASRDHFHIDFRRGKFVLTDNSTNGTWVRFEGQAEAVYLRRESLPLTRPGTIGVGKAISEDDPHLVRFQV